MTKYILFILFLFCAGSAFAQGSGASKHKQSATAELAAKSADVMCGCFNKHIAPDASPEIKNIIDKLVKNKVTAEAQIVKLLTQSELETFAEDLDRVDGHQDFLTCMDDAGSKINADQTLVDKAKAEHANTDAFDNAMEKEFFKYLPSTKSCSFFYYYFLLASKE